MRILILFSTLASFSVYGCVPQMIDTVYCSSKPLEGRLKERCEFFRAFLKTYAFSSLRVDCLSLPFFSFAEWGNLVLQRLLQGY